MFTLNKKDEKLTPELLKIFRNNQMYLKICYVCFGENFTDQGQTIQQPEPYSRR